jgi:predicted amidophosphoribosyltransferase
MSILKRSNPKRCRNCGERVAAYAPGCWLCGHKLDPQRWQRPRGIVGRTRALWRTVVGESRTR